MDISLEPTVQLLGDDKVRTWTGGYLPLERTLYMKSMLRDMHS